MRELQERGPVQPAVTPTPGHLSRGGAVAVAVLAVAVDQASKSWALASLAGREPRHVIGSLQLALSFNSGVAFSLGRGGGLTIVPVALAVIVVVVVVARHLPGRLAATSVGLVVGGAVGNLVDRLVRGHDGAVVDFIDLQWWPVFNVADACIVVGGALLALSSLRRPAEREGQPWR
ncbi:MAG: signal peptidase II [Acidimicrobiales bacterium]